MISLELLAPARNTDIGIAAIGCGADAVYIAGPAFGARKDAGNSVEDIRRLCDYAHQFGARVFVTLNTILMEDELERAQDMLTQLEDSGVDAFIVQDLGVLKFKHRIPFHASTQCSIRTPERAAFLESLGFSRVVTERQISLQQIKDIRSTIKCEIEHFVHGALCVCYSGQCYLSEAIDRRSANRGSCIQACRSLYDLVDENGKTILKNKAILSLKDFMLIDKMEELADAGVSSFKIEGRLKNISYVKNVVRAYSIALDKIVERHPETYRRASFGKVRGGFTPSLDKTFNRGYTDLFLDGERGQWSSMNAPKSMGEMIGTVSAIRKDGRGSMEITVRPTKSSVSLKNGDGFAFVKGDTIVGFRADVANGYTIRCKEVPSIKQGLTLFRNISLEFEKKLESDSPSRLIQVKTRLDFKGCENSYTVTIFSETEDGRTFTACTPINSSKAENRPRMESMLGSQISKKTGLFEFQLTDVNISTSDNSLPFMGSAMINDLRRQAAEELSNAACKSIALDKGTVNETVKAPENITYQQNVSNSLASDVYSSRGAVKIEDAYELTHRKDAELMRSKYCIRHELGLCHKQGAKPPKQLTLVNNGRRFRLDFDCRNCEMILKEER